MMLFADIGWLIVDYLSFERQVVVDLTLHIYYTQHKKLNQHALYFLEEEMLLGTPITWLIAEILVLSLFIVCIVHASRQEQGIIKILELFGFIIYAAIFENIGVSMKFYDYDLHRMMLIGKVPLEVLMIETVIFYVGLRLAEYLRIPGWGKPIVVGFLSSVQDMTVDPTAIQDVHLFNGVMSGQWNWAFRYAGSFFGIPFYNFTGWVYIMAMYAITIQVGMGLYKKYKQELVGYLYPFVGIPAALGLQTIFMGFLMWGAPFFPWFNRTVELTMLSITYAIGLFVLVRYHKIEKPFDFKKDGPVFFVPIVLHAFDIIVALVLGLEQAYIPVFAVSAIHIGFLLYVYLKGKKLATPSLSQTPVRSGS
jgi:uncharacterized membrane protein